MLVLSRKQEEEIIIHAGDEKIRIKVMRLRGTIVRIGIEAPTHMKIFRPEVLAAMGGSLETTDAASAIVA